ncbi:translation elongation factor 4 [Streptococcus castoreus]|uniref:translation elongation factor 4 n=1 Tax=Streptococcus castoreus TaxID=254786 RepID=UPI00040A1AB8|nr:translation elongation factor 4 [Streptococcus castoreus]
MIDTIRNFAIIAHIDHGKSTLADRIMEMTETVSQREAKDQLLDDLSVEQAHGVTVKSRTVRNFYKADDGKSYCYHLIDTPGHVDFSYEVSKSLAACEGVLLLVDATQGIQAQTLANYRLAKAANLIILPVINKIDSPQADVNKVTQQLFDLDKTFSKPLLISAKTGQGVHEVLEAIHKIIPAPIGNPKQPLQALVFDSFYDTYKGVIAEIRIVSGQLSKGDKLFLMQTKANALSTELGTFSPKMTPVSKLSAGEVGYVITGLKNPQAVKIGDTLTLANQPTPEPLSGYQEPQSMVFASFYPKDKEDAKLKAAIEKLSLNDPSFQYQITQSEAMGVGFHCGFLGMFHLQIIRERLLEEFHLEVLATAPTVIYHITLKNGEKVAIDNPTHFPDFSIIDRVEEPYMAVTIATPSESLGALMQLAEYHKGNLITMDNQADMLLLNYEMPLSKISYDFFDKLKSLSHGYANLETSFLNYQAADVVRIDVAINYAKVDALTFILHRDEAPKMTQGLVHKLKNTVPRKLYPMPAQAIVEGKVLARVDIPPLRKNAAVNGEKHSISKKQALLRRQNLNKRQAALSDIIITQEVLNSVLELNL